MPAPAMLVLELAIPTRSRFSGGVNFLNHRQRRSRALKPANVFVLHILSRQFFLMERGTEADAHGPDEASGRFSCGPYCRPAFQPYGRRRA